jgi:hypothetical protein
MPLDDIFELLELSRPNSRVFRTESDWRAFSKLRDHWQYGDLLSGLMREFFASAHHAGTLA